MQIRMASVADAATVAQMLKRLTDEIIKDTGAQHFNIDLEVTTNRARDFLESGAYVVFLAIDYNRSITFAAPCESYALHAEGKFGVIQEFYVDQSSRSQGIGHELLNHVSTVSNAARRTSNCVRRRYPLLIDRLIFIKTMALESQEDAK